MKLIESKYDILYLNDVSLDMHQGINTVTEKVQYLESGIPIIQTKNITSGFLDLENVRYLSEEDYKKYKEKYQPGIGNVLISNIGTIGRALEVKIEYPFLIAWNLFLIKLKEEKILPQYLFHYFEYLLAKRYYDRLLTGGTVKFISKKIMGKIPIPLPPLAEQKRIAKILDQADQLRQLNQQVLEQYDALTQSLFLDMFGDPVVNPMGWEKVKLSQLINKLNTGVSVNSSTEISKNGVSCILKTSCVYSGVFNPKEAKVIRLNEISRAKLNPRKDSIIISRMNTAELVGKSAYINKDYPNLFLPDRLWQSEKTDVEYSVLWLSYCISHKSFMLEIRKISSGTSGSMKNISKKTFLNLLVTLPPINLQNKFAEKIKSIEAQKASAKSALEASEDLFNTLLQKAFKGEL